jgi:hypothetical protein
MQGWPGGINNRSREGDPVRIAEGSDGLPASVYLRDALNVDISNTGVVARRKGYTRIKDGFAHSVWGSPNLSWGLVVVDGWLSRLFETGEVVPVQQVHPYAPVSYTSVNDRVVWCNGRQAGFVLVTKHAPLGLPEPTQPTVSRISGNLRAGTYNIKTTYLNADKEEFGASEPTSIHLDTQGGIRVDTGGPNFGATYVATYVSLPDSEVYFQVNVQSADSAIGITQSDIGRGATLRTDNLQLLPTGHLVSMYNGRLYMAYVDTIVFSEPLRFSLYRPSQGLYMFPSKVTMMEATVDGLYVGGDFGVVFLKFSDPYDVTQKIVDTSAPVDGACTVVSGADIGEAVDTAVVWWSKSGELIAGLPSGNIKFLTRDRLAVPEFKAGSIMLREEDGIRSLVTSLRKGSDVNSMAASDSVVAEVRKNNVKLNQ